MLGYRWAFEFGLDNMDRRRQDEHAFRLGMNLTSSGFLRLIDPFPFFNMVGAIVDLNTDGSVDRYGFQLGFGL